MSEFHGISVGTERRDFGLLLSFKAVGRLTHKDYVVVLPIVDQVVSQYRNGEIYVLIDITELTGWEVGEAVTDIRLAFQYSDQFKKTAVIGCTKWQRITSIVGGWILGGTTRYFSEVHAAQKWLNHS
ncbi:STAS/SEC14 domain-containing protein [Pseudoalteromonas obscura]|uniref:STAS/SEC14 domain-containing protein n=1 Tax=Pseudoalteromonas obscura TaxID=3048491 RepID=A0ABT7EM92_9GAMM|nr:STAS/SEC14 domain-containing protein [Pseudoalteromonas sp. P94(2023)]MDK2596138.1 STAS/SEC14 domain-containing protein [Pseudoalteromonas sp. P94(2023)]